ncbi:recombinase family protein [Gemmata sp. JC673]|uniref:Recombinase family protein n=1 Tax=Gemmata algarum TaxID=2975278 RepID=A0ABU5EUW7_9BACT|nr:recombinase family protein [Gemmata algarum]MDY3557623.1 recombinase family protein [Gemmata algarum]
MRAATYIRMSTADQENSPDRQRNQIEPYCKSKGYSVVHRYEDLGMRGTDDSRPQFQRLLADAQKGLFDVIVVDEQSRLTRTDPVDFIAEVVSPLRNANVVIDTVAKGVINWSDLGQFIVGSVAQHASNNEVATLSRRVVTELARKALKGDVVAGKAPYGYEQVWKDSTGKVVHRGKRNWTKRPSGWEPTLEVKEEEAKVVRWIYEAYTTGGLTLKGITNDLHNQGTPSPKGGKFWNRAQIRNILTNRVYTGDFVFNRVSVGGFHKLGWAGTGEDRSGVAVPKKQVKGKKAPATKNAEEDWVIVPDHHPALVTKEQWEQAQVALKTNRDRCNPVAGGGDYALSNVLVCSHCGSTFVGDRDRTGKFYLCGGYARNGIKHCKPYRVAERNAVGLVEMELYNHFASPVARELLRQQVAGRQQNAIDTDAGQCNRAKRTIATLNRKLATASRNILLLDPERVPDAQNQIRQWESEKVQALATLSSLVAPKPIKDPDEALARLECQLHAMQEARTKSSPENFRKLARACLEKVELRFLSTPRGKLKRHTLVGGTTHFKNGAICTFDISPTTKTR